MIHLIYFFSSYTPSSASLRATTEAIVIHADKLPTLSPHHFSPSVLKRTPPPLLPAPHLRAVRRSLLPSFATAFTPIVRLENMDMTRGEFEVIYIARRFYSEPGITAESTESICHSLDLFVLLFRSNSGRQQEKNIFS